MFHRPFLGSSLAMIAAAMTSAFHTMRPNHAAQGRPEPEWSKNALRREKRRIEGPFPNTTHWVAHNGTAFVYNSERAADRRVRQYESRFLKALDRLGPMDNAAEFG